jgi:ABC-type transport system involved in cytochrome c biogenesis ATPase subunit
MSIGHKEERKINMTWVENATFWRDEKAAVDGNGHIFVLSLFL